MDRNTGEKEDDDSNVAVVVAVVCVVAFIAVAAVAAFIALKRYICNISIWMITVVCKC